MNVFDAVGSFIPVSEADARALSGEDLLLTYDNARDSSALLEILGTTHERTACANKELIRSEVLRRLSLVRE